jgi:hypothetical protein
VVSGYLYSIGLLIAKDMALSRQLYLEDLY